MKSIQRFLGGFILGLLLLLPAQAGLAQEAVTFNNLTVSHIFGESMHFEADISTTQPLSSLELIFKPQGGNSRVVPVTVSDGSHLTAEYRINSLGGFPPFNPISYWFVATLTSGQQVQSEVENFIYSDNRYTWQSLNYGINYHAYWIDGDTSFGQAILDAAINSLTRFEQYLSLPIPETLDLYVYPSSSSLQGGLAANGTTWTAGHADPVGSRAYAAVPNSYDYILDMENTIPHEVTHIRLYLLLGENYANLPVWLNEGIATLSERYPGDKSLVLTAALESSGLYAFEELCSSFPVDDAGVRVAYAQSESLVRYIYDRHGKLGLQTLVEAYGAGHSCKNGVLGSLGITLDDLEDDWYLYQFNQPAPLTGPTAELVGWALLGVVVFLAPVGLILFSKRQYDRKEIINGNGE